MSTLLSQFKSLFKDMYTSVLESLKETKEQRADRIAKEDLSYAFRHIAHPVTHDDFEHYQKLPLDQMFYILDHLKRGYTLDYIKQHSMWTIEQ
ncbi:hypothetical protein ACLCDV_07935 [Sphingobacterium sp. Lzh-3]|uniref:hypothetical protein n=1 Tax=Sphingobacterium sp. Lzh-3 TaxID=3382150 RepID=UPI00398D5293